MIFIILLIPEKKHTKFGEKLVQNAHQVPEGKAIVSHHTLDLMELSQVSGVQGLVAEYSVYREVLDWCEFLL